MSRLWDAVGGFLFLFAHLQEKLSKNASQVTKVKSSRQLIPPSIPGGLAQGDPEPAGRHGRHAALHAGG